MKKRKIFLTLVKVKEKMAVKVTQLSMGAHKNFWTRGFKIFIGILPLNFLLIPEPQYQD